MSTDSTQLRYALLTAPVGGVGLVAGRQGLLAILSAPDLVCVRERLLMEHPAAQEGMTPELQAAATQLQEYFAGSRRRFDLRFDLSGLTPFSREVLEALRQIPFGTMVTYKELAARAGRPRAARAVGRIMALNPFPIAIPCHRVIGSGGALVGYSGGSGLPTKQWLLEFEREQARNGAR